MDKSTFSIILCSIAIFFGIVAIFTTRPYNWDLDFVGLVVAILSLLVTFLMGWNIFSVIDAKGRITAIEKRQVDFTKELEEKYNNLSERSRIAYNESQMFLFYLQGQNSYTDISDNNFLEKYCSFQSSLYYAVQEETDFAIDGIRIALSCMTNCLNERNKRVDAKKEVDDTIKHMNTFQTEIESILTSGNQKFTSSQRSEFVELNNRIQSIIK